MQIELKKATLDDWNALAVLEKQSKSDWYHTFSGIAAYQDYIKNSHVFFIVSNKIIVGSVSYAENADTSILVDGLTVLPKYRRKGIAAYVLQLIMKKLGNRTYTLFVHPHNNPALVLYLKAGFTIQTWKDNTFLDNSPRLLLTKHTCLVL